MTWHPVPTDFGPYAEPGDVRAFASSLAKTGERLATLHEALREGSTISATHWEGVAGQAFRAQASRQAADAGAWAAGFTALATAAAELAKDLQDVKDGFAQIQHVAAGAGLQRAEWAVWPPHPTERTEDTPELKAKWQAFETCWDILEKVRSRFATAETDWRYALAQHGGLVDPDLLGVFFPAHTSDTSHPGQPPERPAREQPVSDERRPDKPARDHPGRDESDAQAPDASTGTPSGASSSGTPGGDLHVATDGEHGRHGDADRGGGGVHRDGEGPGVPRRWEAMAEAQVAVEQEAAEARAALARAEVAAADADAASVRAEVAQLQLDAAAASGDQAAIDAATAQRDAAHGAAQQAAALKEQAIAAARDEATEAVEALRSAEEMLARLGKSDAGARDA
ncbi:hypothetical protein DDE18_01640 [Nocardioides gansuensis]|uniref:Uncharacterized protein n=1 Tax=Nocardioides gansuensis TaxID=2138300 RepID=A0A2T8FF66_9ACTN|nr:hypothetical protein [Nocardioides gansuensis]PVG84353.1 hypothetical protein DDE18_01640 [Nocardioides gansuensis]